MFVDLEVELSVPVGSIKVELQDHVLIILVWTQVGATQTEDCRLEHTHEHLQGKVVHTVQEGQV